MFRCAVASLTDREPMRGTAPTDSRWLFVEEAGPWGAKPLQENRLPEEVRTFLATREAMAVHLVRRHGRTRTSMPVVMAATVRPEVGGAVLTTVHRIELERVESLPDLDLEALFDGTLPGAEPVPGPLWLVCTNGKRDLCCATVGRPVTELLARHWPEGTWETTHLGGHRFSGTLLALPSGHALGRLTVENTVQAASALTRGELPEEYLRGRVGLTGADQVLDLHLLTGGDPEVEVVAEPGPARQQSCGTDEQPAPFKPTTRYRVVPRP